MSSNNVKIKVKFGSNEVEIESPLESIRDAVDVIPNIIRNIGNSVKAAEQVTVEIANDEGNAKNSNNMPEIKIEKGDSLSDMIVKMFRNAWGKQSRRLADVKQVLDSYGLTYPKQSVAVTLMRLVQGGRLRRFKGTDGEFVYTAATSLLPEEAKPAAEEPPAEGTI